MVFEINLQVVLIYMHCNVYCMKAYLTAFSARLENDTVVQKWIVEIAVFTFNVFAILDQLQSNLYTDENTTGLKMLFCWLIRVVLISQEFLKQGPNFFIFSEL